GTRSRLLAAMAIVLALAMLDARPGATQTSPSAPLHDDHKAVITPLRAEASAIWAGNAGTFGYKPFNLADLSKQRNLNERGKELAKAFGAANRAAGVPVGEVYTSQFNRAYETAVLAGFGNIQTTVDLSEGGLVVTPDENNRRARALRTMLAKAPQPGKNDILITHKPNIVDALGKDWFDVKEGEASIFRPEGAAYRLMARVQMEDWPKLTSAGK